MPFTVTVDHNDLARVTRKLGGLEKEARIVIRNTANDTAKHARHLLAEHAQERYTVKNAGFNSRMRLTPANTGNLTALLRARERPLTLTRFHYSASRTHGVKVEILKGIGLHTIIRTGSGREIKSFMYGSLAMQRTGPERKPVRVHRGPGVSVMLEKVWKGGGITDAGLKQRITTYYESRLDTNIARITV